MYDSVQYGVVLLITWQLISRNGIYLVHTTEVYKIGLFLMSLMIYGESYRLV